MKIAVTSDLHGRKPNEADRKAIAECDCLLLCGDIFEPGGDNGKLEKYLKSLTSSGKRVIMTPGNHDFGIYYAVNPNMMFSVGSRAPFCKRYFPEWLKNELGVECLIDEVVEVNGIRIYGTPWTPMFCGWAFMVGDGEPLDEKYSKIPENVDILIAHGPPYDENSKIDCCDGVSMIDGSPEHLGSKSLYKTIIEKKPKYCFVGHIHSGDHGEIIIGETKCRNVSYLNEEYQKGYPVHTFEI